MALALSLRFENHPSEFNGSGGWLRELLFLQSLIENVGYASMQANDLEKTSQQLVELDSADASAASNGNQEAFRRLVMRHQNDIAVQMRRFSRDPGTCEELVHDVFVEAFLSLHLYRGDAPWQHWLRVIAVRVGYRFWKRNRLQKSAIQLSEHDWQCLRGESPSAQLATEAADLVYRVLSLLGESDRLVITLIYLDGCSISEAAARAGWTVTGTKLRAFRARKRLKAIVDRNSP